MMGSVRPRCDSTRPRGAHTFFLLCAFSAGCNATACPRFSSSSNCTGSQLKCVGGKVTYLCGCCEKFNDALLLMLTRGDSQVLVQRAIEWHNSVDDWAIDGAHSLVSRRVCGLCSCNMFVGCALTLSQVLVQRAIEWHNSVDDWAIDGAQFLVSREFNTTLGRALIRNWAVLRYLYGNQLTGSIPPLVAPLSVW
jgi:hypothetical protein